MRGSLQTVGDTSLCSIFHRKVTEHEIQKSKVVILKGNEENLTVFKIIFEDGAQAQNLRLELEKNGVSEYNLKERLIKGCIGPIHDIKFVEELKNFVVSTLKIKFDLTPNVDVRFDLFKFNATFVLEYKNLKIFNSLDFKKFQHYDARYPFFIRYYKYPKNPLCKKCGQKFHPKTACQTQGKVLCYKCGKFHDCKEHGVDVRVPLHCFLCKNDGHNSFFCPCVIRKLVTFEEYVSNSSGGGENIQGVRLSSHERAVSSESKTPVSVGAAMPNPSSSYAHITRPIQKYPQVMMRW